MGVGSADLFALGGRFRDTDRS